MKGSIHFRKDTGWWFIAWYDEKARKLERISWYNGERMYDRSIAEKCLAVMQSDFEKGIFRMEKYTGKGTEIIPFFEKWLLLKKKKTPATYKGYRSYLDCHFRPFFEQHPGIKLNDIRLDTLHDLLNSLKANKSRAPEDGQCPICRKELEFDSDENLFFCPQCEWTELPLSGKMKYNIMNCFHTFMDYAYRSERIIAMPPFPKKEDYGLVEPTIKWLPEDRQMQIINTIPEEHRPIFLFLKYHFRRPGEAMALHKEDYDIFNGVFVIRRSISDRTIVEHTKTHQEHIIPCVSGFRDTADRLAREPGKFFFTCASSRSEGKRYTHSIMNRVWKIACTKCKEKIDMYSGLKHSSCSQFVNEKDGNLSDLQVITDHARYESVKKYAKTQVARKRQLMERQKVLTNLETKRKEKEDERKV